MSHYQTFADRLRDGEITLLELFRKHSPGAYNKHLLRRDGNRQQRALFDHLTRTTDAPATVSVNHAERISI